MSFVELWGKHMDKQIFFLAGLPRSGNTLLSAILNQNPEIYSSPLSPVSSIIRYLDDYSNNPMINLLTDQSPYRSTIEKYCHTYYGNIDKPFIIDREKSWCLPENIDLIKKYINPNPKIIMTVRSIPEVISSLLRAITENVNILGEMQNYGWIYKNFLTMEENICEYLMSNHSMLNRVYSGFLNSYMSIDNKEIFHLVEYDDLINFPQETMNNIYDFLEIDTFHHDFDNIEKIEVDNDFGANLPPDMHTIRKSLEKISPKLEDVLSPYILNKYSNLELWRNT